MTGHNSEKGLDPYDSGNKDEQREISHAIDNVQSNGDRQTQHSDYLQNTIMPQIICNYKTLLSTSFL